jgi:hypothetical protein
MGTSNLRHSLGKRYSALTGQLREVHGNIARIRREAEKIPELEARIPKLEALISSAAMLLEDADPSWRREQTPPIKPFSHLLLVPFGSCGRRGLEVLRQADRPMTAREIALEVLRQSGNEDADRHVVQRTVTAIDACLRSHSGRSVEPSTGKYPKQWRSLANPEVTFDI